MHTIYSADYFTHIHTYTAMFAFITYIHTHTHTVFFDYSNFMYIYIHKGVMRMTLLPVQSGYIRH